MPSWVFEYGRGVGALLLLLFVATFFGIALVPPYLALKEVYAWWGELPTVGLLPFAFILWGLGYAVLVITFKWLTFSRFKPGTYPFASLTAARWAMIGLLVEIGHWIFLRFLIGTPFLNLWYRALGAKIGRRVTINTVIVGDWDMITIDDDVFIGGRATIIGHVGEGALLRLAPVKIGKRCSVGQETAIFPGCTLGDGSMVGAMSLLTKNSEVPAGEIWGGVPARFIKKRGADQ